MDWQEQWYGLLVVSLLGSCFFVVSLVWCVEGYCMRNCEKRRVERIRELFVEPHRELNFNDAPGSNIRCGEYSDCESITSF